MAGKFKQYIKRTLRYLVKGAPVQMQRVVKAEVFYLAPAGRLKGKKVVITGGARGLGYAMAKKFVEEGAQVLIAGRNAELLAEKAAEMGCPYLVLDVRDTASFAVFIEKAEVLLGGLDALVSNAGISLHEGNSQNVTEEQFNAQVETNMRGGFFLAQHFIRRILQKEGQHKGCILFVSSERGAYVDDLPYGITKAAVNSMTQGLAYRFARRGIRVNAVAPGVTASEMTGFRSDGNLNCTYNLTGRVYLPEEVAEIACFLLSDAAWCLNGQILVCNEGKSLHAHWREN